MKNKTINTEQGHFYLRFKTRIFKIKASKS